MRTADFYAYLTRARRDLWAFLETLPDEHLSRPVIPAERFRSLKDLALHIPVVEDSWVHEDILKDSPVWESASGYPEAFAAEYHDHQPLAWMLEYWRAVEASTLEVLGRLGDDGLAREVVVHGRRGPETFTADGLVWHVMQHEARHTAQIAVLARQLGHAPPQLDLIGYLQPGT